ncbi:MAG: hypothetical protein CME67_02345 [Halobacteriovoraceae bacterium]|nr:hypothetical protein [Halobacteriovoraceae bacterium]|tara:strand:- start:1127 stop:1312 length:186 start_codon:yes stop_codon:yes gene_type:complete
MKKSLLSSEALTFVFVSALFYMLSFMASKINFGSKALFVFSGKTDVLYTSTGEDLNGLSPK